MALRPKLSGYKVIPNAGASPANTGSMASNITSIPTIVDQLSMLSYQVSWAGTSPVGAISVQASDDFSLNADGSVKNAGTWSILPFNVNGSVISSIPVSGNSGNGGLDILQIGFYAVRLVYTATSGTGTLTAVINAKVA